MFHRLRYLLAAFDRGEFNEMGLMVRLDRYLDTTSRERAASRKPTNMGLAAAPWGEL
jgi:hypothetical protein